MSNVTHINTNTPVQGLYPELVPAAWVKQDEWLQCGACGFNGRVTHYVYTDAPWCFEAVCNCPMPATLHA